MNASEPDADRGVGPTGPGAGQAGTAVLVLGPEGAGLAVLAGLLRLLGCDPPRDPVAVGPHDGRGAWESAAVAGLPWPDPARARAALEAAFGPAPLPLLKGAALARALPTWLEALEGTGRRVVAVLAVGLPPEGINEAAWDVWTKDVLRAERASRGLRRAVCVQGRLLADWAGEADGLARALGLAWPARAAGEAGADAFAASARAALAASAPAAPPGHAAGALAEVFARWGEGGEDPADWPALDRIAGELGPEDEARPEFPPPTTQAEDAARVGARPSSETGPSDRLSALEAELAAARHERDRLAGELRQRGHEADQQALARATAEAALAKAQAEHAADLRQMDRLRRDVAQLKRDALGELSARLAGLPALARAKARDDQAADGPEVSALREAVAAFGDPRDLAQRLAEANRRAEKRAGEARTLAERLKEAERRAEKRSAEAQALAAQLKRPNHTTGKPGVDELSARLKDAERQARAAQGLADAAQAEVEALRRSTSWRLTMPLRSALRALRRG